MITGTELIVRRLLRAGQSVSEAGLIQEGERSGLEPVKITEAIDALLVLDVIEQNDDATYNLSETYYERNGTPKMAADSVKVWMKTHPVGVDAAFWDDWSGYRDVLDFIDEREGAKPTKYETSRLAGYARNREAY